MEDGTAELRCSSAQNLGVVVPHRRAVRSRAERNSISQGENSAECDIRRVKMVPTGCVQRHNNADAASRAVDGFLFRIYGAASRYRLHIDTYLGR